MSNSDKNSDIIAITLQKHKIYKYIIYKYIIYKSLTPNPIFSFLFIHCSAELFRFHSTREMKKLLLLHNRLTNLYIPPAHLPSGGGDLSKPRQDWQNFFYLFFLINDPVNLHSHIWSFNDNHSLRTTKVLCCKYLPGFMNFYCQRLCKWLTYDAILPVIYIARDSFELRLCFRNIGKNIALENIHGNFQHNLYNLTSL